MTIKATPRVDGLEDRREDYEIEVAQAGEFEEFSGRQRSFYTGSVNRTN